MPDSFSIREGLPGQRGCFWEALEDKQFIAFPGVEPDSRHIGLYCGEELVGWAWLKHMSRVPVLGLAIRKAYRRCGHGTMMVGHLLEKAKELGKKRIELSWVAGNSAAHFYKKLGFETGGAGETADGQLFYKASIGV